MRILYSVYVLIMLTYMVCIQMNFSNTVRNLLSVLFVLFLISAIFVIPAAADDPALTSNLAPSSDFAPNQTKKVTYILDFPLGSGSESDPDEETLYAFNISLFGTSDSPNPSNLVLVTTSVEFDAEEFVQSPDHSPVLNSDNIVYYFNALPAKGSISVQFLIDGQHVYPNETATITATLSQLDGDGDWVSFDVDCENDIKVDYALSSTNLVSLADFSLVRPLLLPTGEDDKSIFVLAKSFLKHSGNMTGPNSNYYYSNYAIDFSSVDITINGVTQTYSWWISNSGVGEAPVYFVPAEGHDTSDLTALDISDFSADLSSTSITLLSSSTYDGSVKYDHTNTSFPFLIIINENFTKTGMNYPIIDFKNISMDVKLKVNDKGGEEVLGFYPNGTTDFSGSVFSIEGPKLTWGGGHSLDLNVYKYNEARDVVVGSGGSGPVTFGHLLSDSANRTEDRFKYQELFTMGLINAVPGDVVIRVEIPDDVTLTHLRIPGPNTDYSKYDEVQLSNGSDTLDTSGYQIIGGNGSIRIAFPAGTFAQGEDITLTFTNLEYFKTHEDSPLNFADTNLIDFVGMTHGSAGAGGSFKVNASYDLTSSPDDEDYYAFDVGYSTENTFSYTLVDDYSVTVNNREIRFSGEGISNNVVSEWEYPFYMNMTISPSAYPYLGTYRANPLDPLNTTSLPNPAVYFVVPDSLEYIPESAAISQSVGIGLEETIVQNSAGQDIVIIRLGNETASGSGILKPADRFLLNTDLDIQFMVRVSDTFKGDSLQVPAYTLLAGSWDPNAVGLSGVWDTKIIRLNDSVIDVPDATVSGLGLVPYGTYCGAPALTSPDPVLSKNVKVSARNSTSLDLTQNPNRGVSSTAPVFEANTDGVFTLNLKSKDFDEGPSDATAIFVLPKSSFTPKLTNISFLSGSDIPSGTSDFELQYAIQTITPGSISYSDAVGWVWKTAAYDSGTKSFTLTGGDNFEDITAVKLNVTNYQGALNLSMPFHISNLSNPSAWNSNAILGQTLYKFGDSNPVDKGYTPAIKYKVTNVPAFRWVNGNGDFDLTDPKSLGTTFDYHVSDNTNLPKWNEVSILSDDNLVNLASVTVTFTPYGGGATQNLSIMFDINGTPGMNGTLNLNQSNFTIDSWPSYVNLQKVGTYGVIYKTAPDIDNRTATATYYFDVVKPDETITLSPGIDDDIEIVILMNEWDSMSFSDFADLSWHDDYAGTIGVDSNGTDPISLTAAHFVLKNTGLSNTFFNEPGTYPLEYTYLDLHGSASKTIKVNLIVLYTGTLTIEAKLGTRDLAGLTINVSVDNGINGSAEATATPDGGRYVFNLKADPSAPARIPYEIAVIDDSNLPAGLKIPLKIVGIGSLDTSQGAEANPTKTFNFEAVSIDAIFNDASHVKEVRLYKDGTSGSNYVAKSGPGSSSAILFEPDAEDWFDDGNYYLRVIIEPGYEITVGAISDGSMLETITVSDTLNHADLSFSFTVEEAPMISGVLWKDIDINSLNDDSTALSGATVKLLDSDGETELSSTQTDLEGWYYFIRDDGLTEGGNYYIQIQPPSGCNKASPIIAGGDQRIDPDNGFKSDLIQIGTGGLGGTGRHQIDVSGGFYYQSSGSGFGSGTIVNNGSNNAVPNNGSNNAVPNNDNQSDAENQSAADSGNQSGTNASQSGADDEAGAGKRFTILGLIVLILSIVAGLIQLFVAGNKRAKQLVDIHRTLRIFVALLMIVIAVIFLLIYDFTGEMILFDWIDLVLAAIFIGQLILIGKIFKAGKQNQNS